MNTKDLNLIRYGKYAMLDMSKLEIHFAMLWHDKFGKDSSLDLEQEKMIVPYRKLRVDFVHVKAKVAIECNGQIWHKGGHSSGKALLRDYEKCNLAQAEGFIIFQLAPEMINDKWLNIIYGVIKDRLKEINLSKLNDKGVKKK